MGNWTIVIQGTGSHHNQSHSDADVMACKFVDFLKACGHNITSATITTGGTDSIMPNSNNLGRHFQETGVKI